MARELTPQQRKRYDEILAKQGKEAAKKFRDGIIGNKAEKDAAPEPKAEPKSEPKKNEPKPNPQAQSRALTPEQREIYNSLQDGKGTAEKWKEAILAGDKAGAKAIKDAAPKKERVMDPDQRKEYDEIKKKEGDEAAKAFRDEIIAGKEAAADPQPTTAQPPADPGAAPVDPIAKDVDGIMAKSLGFGDSLVNKYITDDAFRKIDAETSPEMKAYLSQLQGDMMSSRVFTTEEHEALANLRAGLGGYASPETQAMREAARTEINRDYKSAQAQALQNQARFGLRGGIANAMMQDAGQNRTLATGNLERDLLVKNADEVQRRKEAFANTVRATEDARFGRQDTTTQNYGSTLAGEEGARTGRQIFNTTQGTNKALASSGLALSGAGLYSGQYGNQQASIEAQRQFNEYQRLQQEQIKLTDEWQQKLLKQMNQGNKQISSNYGV